jgi:glucosamine-6-phosphate deaminase
MKLRVLDDKPSVGRAAAEQASIAIRNAIATKGKARIIAASAASQFEFLEALTGCSGIDWKRVELFHLDEYIGLPMTHPASFCLFLHQNLISKTGITDHHLLNGEGDVAEVIREVNLAIFAEPIDVAFLGIGENGHLAFNDPPADFETEQPFIVVTLDEACRSQQVNEGWFPDLSQVPTKAISMSVQQILKSKEILAVVPGPRKAAAIQACFNGEISPMAPASILRQHTNATVYLDQHSAALLEPTVLAELSSEVSSGR